MEAQQAEQSQTMTVALHNSLVVMQREISAMGIELVCFTTDVRVTIILTETVYQS